MHQHPFVSMSATVCMLLACASGAGARSEFSIGGCIATTYMKDGHPLTAAVFNPPGTYSGSLDAQGCDIGVYYSLSAGDINHATIYNAKYFGVLVDGTGTAAVTVDVVSSHIHHIGDNPPAFSGDQHGVAVAYVSTVSGGATGAISGNTINAYQKGGIVADGAATSVSISGNTVTGLGPVDFIAQNGIQVSRGAIAVVEENAISGNDYTPKSYVSCGLLFFDAGGVKGRQNLLRDNEANTCNSGKGTGNVAFK